MQITKKQMKKFNRINKKLKTIPTFFITNYGYLVRKYSYLKKSHYIVKCQLKLRKQRVVLLFNQLKKLGLNRKENKDGNKFQKKCHVRNKLGTDQTSSVQKSKPQSNIRVIETANGGNNVPTVGRDSITNSSEVANVSSLN